MADSGVKSSKEYLMVPVINPNGLCTNGRASGISYQAIGFVVREEVGRCLVAFIIVPKGFT